MRMGLTDCSPRGRGKKTSVKTGGRDANGVVVLVGEDLRGPVEALDLLAIFAHVIRDLVRRKLLGIDPRRAVDTHHVVSHRVGVEVKSNVRVGLDVAHLLAGNRIDEDELAVPPEPHRHRVRVPVTTYGREPDDQLSLEPRLYMLVRRCHWFRGYRIVAK